MHLCHLLHVLQHHKTNHTHYELVMMKYCHQKPRSIQLLVFAICAETEVLETRICV